MERRGSEMISGLSLSINGQVGSVKEPTKALADGAEISSSISAATEEQTTNAKKVSSAMENVNEVTQSTAFSAPAARGQGPRSTPRKGPLPCGGRGLQCRFPRKSTQLTRVSFSLMLSLVRRAGRNPVSEMLFFSFILKSFRELLTGFGNGYITPPCLKGSTSAAGKAAKTSDTDLRGEVRSLGFDACRGNLGHAALRTPWDTTEGTATVIFDSEGKGRKR
jgi:hypothetical protein